MRRRSARPRRRSREDELLTDEEADDDVAEPVADEPADAPEEE